MTQWWADYLNELWLGKEGEVFGYHAGLVMAK